MAELSWYIVSVQKRVKVQRVLFVVYCPSASGWQRRYCNLLSKCSLKALTKQAVYLM